MEVLPSEGAKSAQIPILGYLEGGQNQEITSVGLECSDGGGGRPPSRFKKLWAWMGWAMK